MNTGFLLSACVPARMTGFVSGFRLFASRACHAVKRGRKDRFVALIPAGDWTNHLWFVRAAEPQEGFFRIILYLLAGFNLLIGIVYTISERFNEGIVGPRARQVAMSGWAGMTGLDSSAVKGSPDFIFRYGAFPDYFHFMAYGLDDSGAFAAFQLPGVEHQVDSIE